MRRAGLWWQVGVTGLLVALGSLGAAALAAEEEPLTRWTLRLAYAQLAQYPPGYGTPETY
jgi:hypothetical protein